MNTENWRWFRYDEIFEIRKGFFNKKPEESGLGTIPFIGATDSNNGVTSWYTIEEIDLTPKAENAVNVPLYEKIFNTPCITVSNNGSVGYAFYQTQQFTCSHDVNLLYLKDKTVSLTPSLALFLCGIIECEQFRWTYGRKWRPERMPSSLIKLPINDKGNPDWQWMEDYTKNTLLPKLPEKSRQVWENRYNKVPVSNQKLELESIENLGKWRTFNLNEIFTIEYGSKLDVIKMEENPFSDIAFVTRTAGNNGVCMYVNKYKNIEPYPAGIMTIALGGSIGKTFIQTQRFYTCQNVAVLVPKSNMGICHKIFIKTIIEKECEIKFVAFGRELNSHIKNNFFLKLPAIKNSIGEYEPDWQWMEDYIKGLPYSGAI